jgi:hypothetical protein
MIIQLNTHWRNGKLVCVCTKDGKCRKDHGCELLEFTLEPYNKKDILECFKNDERKK